MRNLDKFIIIDAYCTTDAVKVAFEHFYECNLDFSNVDFTKDYTYGLQGYGIAGYPLVKRVSKPESDKIVSISSIIKDAKINSGSPQEEISDKKDLQEVTGEKMVVFIPILDDLQRCCQCGSHREFNELLKELYHKFIEEFPELIERPFINPQLINRFKYLGIIPDGSSVRSHNVGSSNYSQHLIQPWSIWLDYPELTSWDDDIIKRVLRTKEGTSRSEDYEKIIHDCEERLRQIKLQDYA